MGLCNITPNIPPIADIIYLIEPWKVHPRFDFETKYDLGLPLYTSGCNLKFNNKYAMFQNGTLLTDVFLGVNVKYNATVN